MNTVGTVHSSHSIAQVGTQLPAVDEILINAVAKLEDEVKELKLAKDQQAERIEELENQVNQLI
jgi:hypothetical protein